MTTRYAKKSLLGKLGAKADGRVLIISFATRRAQLKGQFPSLARSAYPDGALWIAWPKGTSGVPTDLTESVVRKIGLTHGVVDIKVAAIDEVWSGLKFVFRLKDRKRAPAPRGPRATRETKR